MRFVAVTGDKRAGTPAVEPKRHLPRANRPPVSPFPDFTFELCHAQRMGSTDIHNGFR